MNRSLNLTRWIIKNYKERKLTDYFLLVSPWLLPWLFKKTRSIKHKKTRTKNLNWIVSCYSIYYLFYLAFFRLMIRSTDDSRSSREREGPSLFLSTTLGIRLNVNCILLDLIAVNSCRQKVNLYSHQLSPWYYKRMNEPSVLVIPNNKHI